MRRAAAHTRGHLHDRRWASIEALACQVTRDESSRGRRGVAEACGDAEGRGGEVVRREMNDGLLDGSACLR